MTPKNYDRDKVMNGFEEDWKQYRQARNTFFLLLVLYVPVCSGIAIASMKLFHTFMPGFVAAFLDGFVSGERHTGPTLALPELRRLVFGNVVV